MTQHRNRKRRGNFLWRTGELVSHSSWESYSILYQLAKLLEQLPKYKWWACSRVPQSVQGSQKWKTDLCIAGINIKTCKEMKHYKRICCVGPKKINKTRLDGKRISQYSGDDSGYQGKEKQMKFKKKKESEKMENQRMLKFICSLSLPTWLHTPSPRSTSQCSQP